MKSIAALVVAAVAVAGAQNTQIAQVHTVYLLPMTSGFDEYLANRLTNLGVFHVVADPGKADAVLTDSLGAAFESRLDELFPEPEPPAPPAASKSAKPGEPAKGEAKDTQAAEPESGMKGDTATRFSSLHRAKGTVFLVDARNRTVLWSIYERSKNSSSAELDHTAERIANRIKRELKGK
jgi:hypothetical protein